MIFATLDNELDGINNKIGFWGKSLNSISEDFNSKQGLKNSLFNKGLTNDDIHRIDLYNDALDRGVGTQTAWYRSMHNASDVAKQLVENERYGKVATENLTAATNASKTAMIGAKVATTALNMALSAGLAIAIQLVISGISELIHYYDNLANKVNDITTEYNDAQDTIQSHSQTIDEISGRYEQLSTGVDAFGNNVSLTTDEFKEYNSICNEIADMYPSLVQGWTKEGNAILTLKGNVEQLTEAYKQEQIEANNALITNAKDIIKDSSHSSSELNSTGNDIGLETWEYKILKDYITTSDLQKYLKENGSLGTFGELIRKMGVDTSKYKNMSDVWTSETIEQAVKENRQTIQSYLDTFESEMDDAIAGKKSLAEAYFSNQLLKSENAETAASKLSVQLQSIVSSIINNVDYETATQWNDYTDIQNYVNGIIEEISSLSTSDQDGITALLDIQTKYNGNKCTAGEYHTAINETLDAISKLDEDTQEQIKVALGIDDSDFKEKYDTIRRSLENEADTSWVNSLNSNEFNLMYDYIQKVNNITNSGLPSLSKISGIDEDFSGQIKDYVDKITLLQEALIRINNGDFKNQDFEKLVKIFPELTGKSEHLSSAITDLMSDMQSDVIGDFSKQFGNISSEKDREELSKFQDSVLSLGQTVGSTAFSIDIETEIDDMDKFYTAMKESVSATGLTAESIANLKARYQDLENYDASRLFEKTANGIHLNTSALRNLEAEYEKKIFEKNAETLDSLTNEYNNLTTRINEAQDAETKAILYSQREDVLNKIKDSAELAAQYEGLTSAFNKWQQAQNIGEEGDMYDSVTDGLEHMKELYKEGLVGTNEFRAAVQLMSNEDLSTASIDELIAAYDKGYPKMQKYFKDGSDGCLNFLHDVQKLNSDWAHLNQDGSWDIDFGTGNDQKIADALGINVESVQSILRKLSDFGFDINLDSIYTSFDLLETNAEKANKKLKELGRTDYDFVFGSKNIEDINEQLKEAKRLYDELERDENGSINLEAEGARETVSILETLARQKAELSTPTILKIDASKIDDKGLRDSVTEIQESLGDTHIKLSIAREIGDTELIEDLEAELKEKIKSLSENNQIFIEAGIDENSSWDDIQAALNKYQEEHPEINIETKIDENEISQKVNAAMDAVEQRLDGMKIDFDFDNGFLENIFGDGFTIKVGADTEDANKNLDETSRKADDAAKERTTKVNADTNDGNKSINGFIGLKNLAAQGILTPINANIGGGVGSLNKYNSLKNEASRGVTTTVTANTSTAASRIGSILSNLRSIAGNWVANVKSVVNGINRHQGTAHAYGTAWKNGNWGTKENGVALMGELGEELIVRGSNWFTVGEDSAGFYKYQKGDIIFNAEQTKQIFEKGKITNGNKRGTTFAQGTAFSNGSGKIYANGQVKTNSSGSSNNKSSKSSGNSNDKDPEVFDWIEVAIQRIEEAIDRLDQKANNVFKSWKSRNSAIADEITQVSREIDIQSKGYDRYIQEANSVGLSSSLAKKVREGTIDINEYNEDTQKLISSYKEWYDKAEDCKTALEELREAQAKLYKDAFDNIAKMHEEILDVIDFYKSSLDEKINQTEEKGYLISTEYYSALIKQEKDNNKQLSKERTELLNSLEKAMKSGTITKGSEAWYEMCSEIDQVTLAIEESNTALLEYQNTIRKLDWEVFELIQKRISDITNESDFLIDLISNDKLYKDNGQLTDKGLSTMGLHGVNYNVAMAQADEYGKKVNELNKEISKDPYNQTLIDKRDEYLELQRESILAAEDEKQAIVDMVKEGIELELDSLKKLIDTYTDALDAQKKLYDYQKNVEKQTKEIAKLQKQISAYSGDVSEETKAKIQELKVNLNNAEEELRETEYEKYISDQKELLDELYNEYEITLNERLDNIDALISDMIAEINANATTISDTLSQKAEDVGINLSDKMTNIWDTGSWSGVKTVLTTYNGNIINAVTTVSKTVSTISTNIASMITQLNSIAKTNVKATTSSSSTTSKQANTKPTSSSTTSKPSSSNSSSSSGDGKPKVGERVKFNSGKYYGDSYGGNGWGNRNQGGYVYITRIVSNPRSGQNYPIHISTGTKLGSGDLGWLKLNQLSGYKLGKRRISNSQYAWTQEMGRTEAIIRPSDNAILTPLNRGDSVLNSAATSNLFDFANNPNKFINDNIEELKGLVIPKPSSNNTFNGDIGFTLTLPNVTNYEEFKSKLQHDKKFESMIRAVSTDKLFGGSSLKKYKY